MALIIDIAIEGSIYVGFLNFPENDIFEDASLMNITDVQAENDHINRRGDLKVAISEFFWGELK